MATTKTFGSKIENIVVPNIFITNNYNVLQKYFLNQKTFNGITDPKDIKDSFLITPDNNKYLVSLEHSNNFEKAKHNKLVLQFLDTDGRLEDDFFIFKLKSFTNLIENIYRKEQQFKDTLVSGALLGSGGDLESRLKFAGDTLSVPHQIYISYGIGTELSNWSSPMVFHLLNMSMDISNGLRRYTLEFYPSSSSVFRSRIQFNLQNPNPEREFLFTDNIAPFVVSYPFIPQKDTLDSVIYNLLKKYVSLLAVTDIENVICILPVLPNSLNQELKENLSKYFNINIELFIDTLKINTQDSVSGAIVGTKPDKNTTVAIANSISELANSLNYVLRSQKISSSINPAFPNFYGPLNKISNGYKSILTTVDELTLIEENDSRLLNIFYINNLIKDPSSRCIIIGFESLINEYLYRNTLIAGDNLESNEKSLEDLLKDFKPKIQIIDCKEKGILNSNQYRNNFINLYNNQKSRSSLNEEINLDELAFAGYEKISNNIKNNKKLFDFLGIPIFTNNLKNSNILNINLNNSEIYLAGLKTAIDSNAAMFFLSNITRNLDSLNIKGLPAKSLLDLFVEKINNLGNQLYESKSRILGYQGNRFDPVFRSLNPNFDPSGIIKNLGPGNLRDKKSWYKEFRDALDKVIRQQLKLAKQEGIEVNSIEDLVSDDLMKFNKKLDAAKKYSGPIGYYDSNLVNLTGGDNVYDRMSYSYAANLFPSDVPATDGTSVPRLGEIFTSEQVKIIIQNLKQQIGAFDKLLLKDGGDFNLDLLIFSEVIRQYEIGLEYDKDFDSTQTGTALLSRDIRIESKSRDIDNLERLYNLALILTKLFTIKGYNESATDEFKDGVMFKPKQFGLTQDNLAAELWKYTSTNSYNVTIKTLPFFHLSTLRSMTFKPCFLFSRKMNILSPSKPITNKMDFFSGMYNILGFKHVINTKDCYSQFVLVKNIGNAMST